MFIITIHFIQYIHQHNHQINELEKCKILIFEEKITNVKDLVPLLEESSKAGVPLLIIAEDSQAEEHAEFAAAQV